MLTRPDFLLAARDGVDIVDNGGIATRPAVDEILRSISRFEPVVSGASEHLVRARSADDHVVAREPVKTIVRTQAENPVGPF